METTRKIKHNICITRLKNLKGMTVAEMLVTVMIILILCGVGFIALSAYQRSMAQIQRDGYAKEIFIAAQNHLTMAKGEGYQGITSAVDKKDDKLTEAQKAAKERIYGHKDSNNEGVYYFAVNSFDQFHDGDSNETTILDLMLPFGSIDDIVRTTGRYVIRYQPSTATILDVFYCTAGKGRFDHDLLVDEDEYSVICSLADKGDSNEHKSQRRTYDKDNYGGRSVLGWYGGADLESLPYKIKTPILRVINDNALYVEVVDEYPEKQLTGGINFRIILTGMTSKAQKSISLDPTDISTYNLSVRYEKGSEERTVDGVTKSADKYTFTLDDITQSNTHFLDLVSGDAESKFIMGEDLKIEAVAYSKTKLANIAYSEAETTNSLYESLSEKQADNTYTAYIGNIRHLENLEEKISRTGFTTNTLNETHKKLTLSSAEQTRDIDWKDYFNTKTIYEMGGASHTGFLPVSYESALAYDGLRHSIKNVKIVPDTEAENEKYTGLFGRYGALPPVSQSAKNEIKNLELISFDVTAGEGYTGTLAGSASGTKIFNVVAYNVDENDSAKKTPTVKSRGVAGGLIGHMSGGSMRYSAAALVVEGGSVAGGLIGTADNGARITASYSGGHTENAEYYEDEDKEKPLYNVKATDYAGGLIGQAGGVTLKSSYSTCSARATTNNGRAGGLIGNVSSSTNINNCYSTGLTDGGSYAFIGTGGSKATVKDCKFFEIINESKGLNGMQYKSPGKESGVEAIDKNEDKYQEFVGDDSTWKNAVPYDDALEDYYNKKYNLMTVTQLMGNGAKGTGKGTGNFVDKHYGDWPAPEVFIINLN